MRCGAVAGGVAGPEAEPDRSVPLWFFQIFRISAFQIFRTAHLHFNVMGAGASVNDGLPTTNSFTQLPALPPPALPTLEQSGEEGLQTNTNVDGEVDLIEQPIQSIQSIESKAHVTQLNLPIQHKRVCDDKNIPTRLTDKNRKWFTKLSPVMLQKIEEIECADILVPEMLDSIAKELNLIPGSNEMRHWLLQSSDIPVIKKMTTNTLHHLDSLPPLDTPRDFGRSSAPTQTLSSLRTYFQLLGDVRTDAGKSLAALSFLLFFFFDPWTHCLWTRCGRR